MMTYYLITSLQNISKLWYTSTILKTKKMFKDEAFNFFTHRIHISVVLSSDLMVTAPPIFAFNRA